MTAQSTSVSADEIGARLDRLPWSRTHLGLLLALGAGWMFDSLEVNLVGSVIGPLGEHSDATTAQQSRIFWVWLIGILVGALAGGALADRFGRRRLFMITVIWYAGFTVLTAFSPSLQMLYILRFLTALGRRRRVLGDQCRDHGADAQPGARAGRRRGDELLADRRHRQRLHRLPPAQHLGAAEHGVVAVGLRARRHRRADRALLPAVGAGVPSLAGGAGPQRRGGRDRREARARRRCRSRRGADRVPAGTGRRPGGDVGAGASIPGPAGPRLCAGPVGGLRVLRPLRADVDRGARAGRVQRRRDPLLLHPRERRRPRRRRADGDLVRPARPSAQRQRLLRTGRRRSRAGRAGHRVGQQAVGAGRLHGRQRLRHRAWTSAYPTFTELFPTHLRAAGVGTCVAVGRIGAAYGTLYLPGLAERLGPTSSYLLIIGFWAIGVVAMVLWTMRGGVEAAGKPLGEVDTVRS